MNMPDGENIVNVARKPKPKKILKKYLGLILILLVIVLALTSVYFYKKSVGVTDKVSQEEVKSLVQKVSRLVIVPSDETPTIATVSDPEALKNQAFFVDAKKGDKVLIYSNAKKAILYDPVADKIVNIAPLNSETPPPTTTPVTTKPTTKN